MNKAATIIAIMSLCLCGCVYPYFRSMNGTSASVAVSLPNENQVQLQICEYLNGEKCTVRDVSRIKYKYTSTSTNNYFGLIKTAEFRTSDIDITPVLTNQSERIEK